MTAFHYTPGGWHAIVAPAGVAVLPAGVSGEMLERLWLSLLEGHGLGAVLESLTGAFGTSLRAIPPFAVATVDGSEVRLAVRGELAIDVVEAGTEGAADAYSVSGADVTTWSERVVPAAHRLLLRATSAPEAPDGADGADGGPTDARYRIASGIVLSSSIEVDLTAPTITVPTPAPPAAAATSPAESTDRTEDAPTGAAGSTADSPASPAGPAAGATVSADPTADAATGAAHPAAAATYAVPADGSSASPATTSLATSGSESPVVAGAGSPTTPATESPASPEAASATPVADSRAAAEADSSAESVGGSQDASETAAAASTEEIHEATLLPEDVPVVHSDENAPAAPPAPTAPTDGVEQTVDDETALADDEPSADAEAEVPAEVSIDEELGSTRSELPDDAYDHLWGATVVKSVEQAAVRELDDDETETDSASAPTASPAAPPAAAPPASAPESPAAASAPSAPASFAPPTPQAPTAPAPVTPTAGGLISGIPDFGNVGAASGSAGFDAHTVPPAVPATPATPPATAAPASTPAHPSGIDDDHDGLTVTVSELEAMRRLDAAGAGEAHQPATGSLGRVVLSTGETHALDRGIIIGRRPRANRVQADQVPILVTVPSPEQDISRNHLEIRLEGRHVLVVDLDTTNGSVLHRTGTPPLRLGPNEPVLVLDGDLVDLGDGVTVSFEEIP